MNVAYFIEDKLSTKAEFESLNKDSIENIFIYKDKQSVIEYNKMNNTNFDNIIKVELKKKDSTTTNN